MTILRSCQSVGIQLINSSELQTVVYFSEIPPHMVGHLPPDPWDPSGDPSSKCVLLQQSTKLTFSHILCSSDQQIVNKSGE